MQSKVLSVLVENHVGVLARVSSLFCQRGFNIDSLTVSATDNPEVSRITVTTHGDEQTLRQIIRQTEKLVETRSVMELEPACSLLRELLLVKVAADKDNRRELHDIAEIYRAKTIDLSVDSMIFELTGDPDKIDGFLRVLAPYQILEMCRTGVTALSRGSVACDTQSPATFTI